MNPKDWPDETRIDIIGTNGGDGAHYDEIGREDEQFQRDLKARESPMQNQIKILATTTVADTVIKLAAVGSGHHVISYKVTADSKTHHEATMHSCPREADYFYRARVRSLE